MELLHLSIFQCPNPCQGMLILVSRAKRVVSGETPQCRLWAAGDLTRTFGPYAARAGRQSCPSACSDGGPIGGPGRFALSMIASQDLPFALRNSIEGPSSPP